MTSLALACAAIQIATAWAAPGGGTGAPSSRPTSFRPVSQKSDEQALYIIIGCVVVGVIAVTLTVFWCIRACSRAEAERARSARKEFEKGQSSSGSGSLGGESGHEDGVYSFSFEKGEPDHAEDGISGLLVEVNVEGDDVGGPASITRRNMEIHNRALLEGGIRPPAANAAPQGEVWRPVFSERFKVQGWQSDVTKSVVFKMPTTGTTLLPQLQPQPHASPPLGESTPVASRRKSVRRSSERPAGDD